MANNQITDVVKYTSAADLSEYWLNQIAPDYFNFDNVNTYKSGVLGYLHEILGNVTEDSVHAMTIARREFYPNTAQYMKSLYKMAAARQMDLPMATPATATVLLLLQESDIINEKYGIIENGMHKFVLDDTFIAHVDDIPFMLDHPIVILSKPKSNDQYAHTTHYDFTVNNSLNTSTEKYVPNKVMNYQGTKYLVMSVVMRQISKTYSSQIVTSNSIINTVTMDFPFDGNLANFEVFYKENDSSPRIQLMKLLDNSNIPKNPFCWYTLIDGNTIRLTFPANIYFVPKLNSEISIEIATTLGSKGNFEEYDGDIISENPSERYPYNNQVPIFGTVEKGSTGGMDIVTDEEFRTLVSNAYATNHTYITTNDLQLYFNKLMIGTNDRFKFTKKRDDAFIRLYGSFLMMKDAESNIVPTNTLDVKLDPLKVKEDFDIYSDVVNRYLIKPGAIFEYEESSGPNNYNIIRRKDLSLTDDISNYDKGIWVCNKCGYIYEDPSKSFYELVKRCECGATASNAYVCPSCGATIDQFSLKRFLFTNPYLISVSTDNFMAGYFLNSIQDYHSLAYTNVNDDSIVQFIAKTFKIERNAIAGENFYRFSFNLSPSISLDVDTIYKERDNKKVAKYNGKIISVKHNGTAVYAKIMYTSDDVLEEIPENEVYDTVQVSSYIEKVNDYRYICPKCGKQYTESEYASLSLEDENGNPLFCFSCNEDDRAELNDYVRTFVDFDYHPGYNMKFNCGDSFTKNDVIALAKPKDLGRIRTIMDLNKIMSSNAKRYVPFTIEGVTSTDQNIYFECAAYLTTDDAIDSSNIMSIETGFALQDGSSGINQSLSIPINNLTMKIMAFYEYREDDDIGESTNPAHSYSNFQYVQGRTYTNTYELQENDTITLIKSLDFARGFLDVIARAPDIKPVNPDIPDDIDHYPHCPAEKDENPDQTDLAYPHVYLRSINHERFLTNEIENDSIPHKYLTVLVNPIDPNPGPTPEPEKPVPGDPSDPTYGSNFLFYLRNCPVISANWVKSKNNEKYFIEHLTQHYEEIEKIYSSLENAFAIDMKFYNTYGKSKFYKIGSNISLSVLDTVNCTLSFGVSLNFPASAEVFRNNFKNFVKEYIESVDNLTDNGIDIYIMNLISEAKAKFDEIHYIEYYGMNYQYDQSAQRITIMSDEDILKTVKADSFVPEFLNVMLTRTNNTVMPDISITILE